MTLRIFPHLFALGLAYVASGQNTTLITTFTNPAAVAGDNFGNSAAALGSERLIIGAWSADTGAANAGAAYLLNTNGSFLTVVTNPAPASSDYFGYSVAAVGSDGLLIGAPGDDASGRDSGSAYLTSTNGILVTTFSNPNSAGGFSFGHSVAAVGSDRVLIGAPGDHTGALQAGAVYLFSTNGLLLTTITNPAPAASDWFGQAVTAVGNDRVAIGASRDDSGATDSGSAFLFNTDGNLLTTFINPAPAEGGRFAVSVAAVGDDRVLIGAYGGTGAAYLFDVNGALITTFANPTPAGTDWFGIAVAAIGSDRVLIGAMFEDGGAPQAGAAYLFSTNGTLLATITNPTPADSDWFGASLTMAGSDRMLIGAYQDDTAAPDAGAAYLFSLAPPTPPALTITPAILGNTTISWAPSTPGFVLQETELLSPADWTNSLSGAASPTVKPAALPAKYYRLRQP